MFGVIDNIGGYALIRWFIADDMFPIIALPQFSVKWLPTILFYPTDVFNRNNGLKCPHHFTNGFWFAGRRRGNPLWLPRYRRLPH